MSYQRHSPIASAQQALKPELADHQGMQVAARFAADSDEQDAIADLAVCDLSALPRFGLKGKASEAWLKDKGISTPEKVYEWTVLSDDGGRCMRVDRFEFFLEDTLAGSRVKDLAGECKPGKDLAIVPHQNAAFYLCGKRADLVLAQTCGMASAGLCEQLVYTRVAGVNALILGSRAGDDQSFRLWIPASYGIYLWNTFVEISTELGGKAVGIESLKRKTDK